jgi:hypothetical protein
MPSHDQTHDGTALNPACAAAVEVFDSGLGVFELGAFEQARTAPILSSMHFTVNQQSQPLFKAQGADTALAELLLKRLGHALEAQAAQLVQGMHHHFGTLFIGNSSGRARWRALDCSTQGQTGFAPGRDR